MNVALQSKTNSGCCVSIAFSLKEYKALQANNEGVTPEQFILKVVQKAMDTDVTTSDLIDYHRRIVEA